MRDLFKNLDPIWQFDTPNFRVCLFVEPENVNPADHFSDKRDIAYARRGGAHWFHATVAVYFGDDSDNLELIAWYSLGCCSYRSFKDFYAGHRDPDPMNRNCTIMRAARGDNVVICHYFPGMVSQAIGEARAALARQQAKLCGLRLRVS